MNNNGHNTVTIPKSFWIDAYEATHGVGFFIAQVDRGPFANAAADYLTV